jgi:hypothetical protein
MGRFGSAKGAQMDGSLLLQTSSTDHLETRPRTGEAPFGLDELFFSRTDARGVLQAWNAVFARVAHHPPERLKGAPHRIIRHEQMPKGVFWLMWEAIKSGQRFGGYVLNKSSDDLQYWVYAVVTPIADGFTSVRLKPSSALFPKVQALYAQALAAERDEGLSPEASGHRILAALAAMGYPTYAAFASASLGMEITARDAALGRPLDRRIMLISAMREMVHDLVSEQQVLLTQMNAMRLVPVNMRIMAARIERAGGALSAISDNYRTLSAEVAEQLAIFVQDGTPETTFTYRAMERALFLTASARLLVEAADAFRVETTTHARADLTSGVDILQEVDRLNALEEETQARASEAFRNANQRTIRRESQAVNLGRAILSLDSIRIMCRVENERLQDRESGLSAVVSALDGYHKDMAQKLETILGFTQNLREHAQTLEAMRH